MQERPRWVPGLPVVHGCSPRSACQPLRQRQCPMGHVSEASRYAGLLVTSLYQLTCSEY